MSEFNELVKNFNKIREYMREFFVYGFKTREELAIKSKRSYDDDKRRIDSYLNDYMSFYQNEKGKNIFLQVESRHIKNNPLYRAFKTKSFTANDISLHFILMDILSTGETLTLDMIAERVYNDYLSYFRDDIVIDNATIRKKLNDYVDLGIFSKAKLKNKDCYSIVKNNINCDIIKDAVLYYSEVSPIGVIGSYILDKIDVTNELFCYKHHYILYAMESEVLFDILDAIDKEKKIRITNKNLSKRVVIPLRIFISTSGGRRYLGCCVDNVAMTKTTVRIDDIKSIELLDTEENYTKLIKDFDDMSKYVWGVSFRDGVYTLRITFRVEDNEKFIVDRLENEGRNGNVTMLDKNTYQYEVKVCDPTEVLPWIRTFICRIIKIECEDKRFIKKFREDLKKMYEIYGV